MPDLLFLVAAANIDERCLMKCSGLQIAWGLGEPRKPIGTSKAIAPFQNV